MNSIFDNNLQLLMKYQPHVYYKLSAYLNGSYQPRNKLIDRILLARQEDAVFNILVECGEKKYLLCDHEDPINESYSWIDKYVAPAIRADVVFGLGLGFHLDVLITSFKNKKVIVVEPDIELFYQILNVRNLDAIIEKSEIYVDEDYDAIIGRIRSFLWDAGTAGVHCEPFEVYAEMFPELWEELKSKFIKQAENFTVDIATRKAYGEDWVHNNIKNLPKIVGASDAGRLVGQFKGIPGVLVSAGPSLSKNMHYLNSLKDKAVIMAAGTAVTILEGSGIIPHFMVGIDAGEAEAEMHRKVKSRDIYFIYSNQVAEGSLTYYEGPKFYMNYPVDIYSAEFLRRCGVNSEFYLSGPSVSNTCFDILVKMGCDPIIVVGQDLAFTGRKIYAEEEDGSLFENEEEFISKGYVKLKDIHGNDVFTANSFIAMRNWFEGYFEKVKDRIEVINATEGGLNIEHACNKKLAKVIEEHNFKSLDIEGKIRGIFESGRFKEEYEGKVNEYMEFVLEEIGKLEEGSRSQLKLMELVKRGVYHPDKDKNSFNKTVARINELSDKVTDSPIFESVLKNLIEIDFYLIKMEVSRATRELDRYEDIKEVFVKAVTEQNRMLKEKLEKVKAFLNRDSY